ncbi:28S ribosomal protein S5, mitochondrial [Ceratocystis pirilliformis]|uniref:28S ribosomal protein S5, mitochondrial n=1 Tax=Ceratocystis pirilliformis TaxID=259994 RepID=A0ABR3ZN99_9PEZI
MSSIGLTRPAARSLLSRSASASLSAPTSVSSPCTAARLNPLSFSSPPSQCSQFHNSAVLEARRPPRRAPKYRYISPESKEFGFLGNKERTEAQAEIIRPTFTENEWNIMRERYTPEQLEAVKLAEESITADDLVVQGRLRNDPHRPEYFEDFAKRHPIIDIKPEVVPRASDYKFLSHHEYLDKIMGKIADRAVSEIPGMAGNRLADALKLVRNTSDTTVDLTQSEMAAMESSPAKLEKTLRDSARNLDTNALKEADTKLNDIISNTIFTDKHGNWRETLGDMDSWGLDTPELEQMFGPRKKLTRAELFRTQNMLTEVRPSYSALGDELGKIGEMAGQYQKDEDPDDMGLDETGEYTALKQRTGLQVQDLLSVITKVLSVRNVHNQTRLGKVRSVSVFAVAGNGDGRLGVGQAKSTDPMVATITAKMLAIQNMVPIRRYENRTIYGTVKAKISGTIVELRARPPGFGLRVSHRIFEMCRAAGIHDLSAIIPRNKNPMNTVKAVFQALTNQPDPEEIARGRGKKLVDVRKVYFGGNVY